MRSALVPIASLAFLLSAPVAGAENLAHATLDWDDLSGSRSAWQGQRVGLEHRAEDYTAGIESRWTRRFDRSDRELSGYAYLSLSEGWDARLRASYSDTASVLPRYSLESGLSRGFGDGWVAHLGYRSSDYSTGEVGMGLFTLERYIGRFRLAYSLYAVHLEGGGDGRSHLVRADRYYGERSRIGLGLSIGDVVERVGAASLLVSRTDGLVILGEHWFSERWAIRWDLGQHDLEGLYRRSGISVGLVHRF